MNHIQEYATPRQLADHQIAYAIESKETKRKLLKLITVTMLLIGKYILKSHFGIQ